MARMHYHIVVSTQTRDAAFIARTKSVADRWMRHFKRYQHGVISLDMAPCSGESCIAQSYSDILL